jgi:hypothetical protein
MPQVLRSSRPFLTLSQCSKTFKRAVVGAKRRQYGIFQAAGRDQSHRVALSQVARRRQRRSGPDATVPTATSGSPSRRPGRPKLAHRFQQYRIRLDKNGFLPRVECSGRLHQAVENDDAPQTVKALIVANGFPEAQVAELRAAGSTGHPRGWYDLEGDRKE